MRPVPSAGDGPVEAGPGRLAVGRPPRQGLRRTPGAAQGHNSIKTFGLSYGLQSISSVELIFANISNLLGPQATLHDKAQGGPSGRGKPPVDSVLTVLAAGGPLL